MPPGRLYADADADIMLPARHAATRQLISQLYDDEGHAEAALSRAGCITAL